MSARTLGRRQMLLGAGATAGGLALVGMGGTPAMADDEGNDRRSLNGSWLVTRQDDSQGSTPVQTVISFAAGGVFATQDLVPYQPSNLGSWAGHGHGGFRATFWGGQAAQDGEPATTVLVHVRGSVHDGTISGTYSYQVFLAGTSTVIFTNTGTFSGSRIAA